MTKMFPMLHHDLDGDDLFKIRFGKDQINPLHYRLVDYHTFTDVKLKDILLSTEYEIMRIGEDGDVLDKILDKKDVFDVLNFIKDKVVLTLHMKKFLPCMYELMDLPRFKTDRKPMPQWIIDSNRNWNECKLYLLPHTYFMRFSTMLNGVSWDEKTGKNTGGSDGKNYTHNNIRVLYAKKEPEEEKKVYHKSTNYNGK